jgi:hypothetical protein
MDISFVDGAAVPAGAGGRNLRAKGSDDRKARDAGGGREPG